MSRNVGGAGAVFHLPYLGTQRGLGGGGGEGRYFAACRDKPSFSSAGSYVVMTTIL